MLEYLTISCLLISAPGHCCGANFLGTCHLGVVVVVRHRDRRTIHSTHLFHVAISTSTRVMRHDGDEYDASITRSPICSSYLR